MFYRDCVPPGASTLRSKAPPQRHLYTKKAFDLSVRAPAASTVTEGGGETHLGDRWTFSGDNGVRPGGQGDVQSPGDFCPVSVALLTTNFCDTGSLSQNGVVGLWSDQTKRFDSDTLVNCLSSFGEMARSRDQVDLDLQRRYLYSIFVPKGHKQSFYESPTTNKWTLSHSSKFANFEVLHFLLYLCDPLKPYL